MLRISKLTDYALLIMSEMARVPLAIRSAKTLAGILHLNLPTVSKILKLLLDGGLVKSVRGVDGGYLLTRPPTKISVADIIIIMEGKLAMTECCESVSFCTIDSVCTLRSNWRSINRFVHRFLSKLTIADMLSPLDLQGLAE